MNDAQNDMPSETIAFLDVMTFEDGKAFRGGVFVTDTNTYPLEFRVTTPIRPTSLQAMLYGRTLENYIYVELVTLPLLQTIKSKPAFVFVNSDLFLKARPKVHLPIFQISKADEFKIKTHPKYKEELQAARPILLKLNQSLLIEAFSRVRAALQEAHKQQVGEK